MVKVFCIITFLFQGMPDQIPLNGNLFILPASAEIPILNTGSVAPYQLYIGSFSEAVHALCSVQTSEYDKYLSCRETQDYAMALVYLEKYHHIKDSLSSIYLGSIVSLNENINRRRVSLLSHNFAVDKHEYRTFSAILWFLLFLVIFFFFTHLWRTKRNRQKHISIMEKLGEHNDDLLAMLHQKSEKEKRLKALLYHRYDTMRRFAGMYFQYEHNRNLLYKKYDETLKRSVAEEKLSCELLVVVNELYDGAIDRLKEKHPNLTSKDMVTICLACADFSNHEISVLFDIPDLNTIYVRKTRIKNKLGLCSKESIEDYVKNL